MIIRMEIETVQYAFSKSNLATSTPATRLDLADDIVHFHLLQRESPPRNAVTDAMFQSATLIQDKLSLTRLVFLWDHSKATDMKVRNWRYKVGTSDATPLKPCEEIHSLKAEVMLMAYSGLQTSTIPLKDQNQDENQ